MPVVHLSDRSLVKVAGPDARKFLHNVVTCNVETLQAGGARFGALLMPQGKIISDFLIYQPRVAEGAEEYFRLDIPAIRFEDLVKRLTMYRLRSQVTLTPEPDLAVAARFGADAAVPEGAEAFPDPRVAELGARLVLPRATAEALGAPQEAYEAHRIALAIPKGGPDFTYGDAFPHEADMDQLGGIDFKKGCYIGQEVVSRTQHRGIARTRTVGATFASAPDEGIDIRAGEKTVGRIGSTAQGRGIALVRLDRVADAKASGLPLVAGDVTVELEKPSWAGFAMEGPAS